MTFVMNRRRAGSALTWAIPVLLLLVLLSPAAFGATTKHKPRRHRTPTPTHTATPAASAAPTTAAAQGGVQFSISGDVDVPKGATVADVLVVRGNVTVEGTVNGDIFVVSGSITVSGHVNGSTISLKGPVTLKSSAVVSGDAMSGGAIAQAAGSKVAGKVKPNYSFTLNGFFGKLGAMLTGLMIVFSTALLGFGMLYLAPRSADRIAQVARADPIKSAIFGVLTAVALPVVAALAMATIVGVPLGVAMLLALAFLYLLGFTCTLWIAGRTVFGAPRSRALAFGGGLAVAAAISLVPSLNLAVWTLASIFGVGSMAQTFWKARRPSEDETEAVAGARPARPARPAGGRPAPAAAGDEEEAEALDEDAGTAQPGDVPGLAPRPRPAARPPAAAAGDIPGLAPRPRPRPAARQPAAEPEDVPGLAPRPRPRPAARQPAAEPEDVPGLAPRPRPRPAARQPAAGGPALPPPPPMPDIDDEDLVDDE
jgi:uncharacterized membrane protein